MTSDLSIKLNKFIDNNEIDEDKIYFILETF